MRKISLCVAIGLFLSAPAAFCADEPAGSNYRGEGVYPTTYDGKKYDDWHTTIKYGVSKATPATTSTLYSGKKSTHTAGALYNSGAIPNTMFDVTQFSFRLTAGTGSVSGLGGDINMHPDYPFDTPEFALSISSPTIQVDLTNGSTIYYDIWGKVNE